MAEERGKKRTFGPEAFKEEEEVVENGASSGSSVSEVQEAKARLRVRWELASVLNFLQVFRSVVHDDLKISSEQIEEGLIRPNGVLAKIHIALLKGIPPVSKNLGMADAWVTALCKKINTWWPWVAEGDLPLVANHGVEIARYKEFDPTTRLLILKALCEIRAEQDDIVEHIGKTLKSGSPISTFRKDHMGKGANGTTYWFDGDSELGYRLYRQTLLVDPKKGSKGKGSSTMPTVEFLWETIATDTKEFQDISARLLDSRNKEETLVGNTIEKHIMPIVEKLQKKKDRAMKKLQRETMLLACSFGDQIGSRRSCRYRKPANYTFDDFDRSIREAIAIENKWKAEEISKGSSRKMDLVGNNASLADNKSFAILKDTTDGYNTTGSDGCNTDLDDDGDSHDDYFNIDDSDEEIDSDYSDKNTRNISAHGNHSPGRKQKYSNFIDVKGSRRCARNTGNTNLDNYNSNAEVMGHAEMKKRLRERPTLNVDHDRHFVPDSEDENESEKDHSFPAVNRLVDRRDGTILAVN